MFFLIGVVNTPAYHLPLFKSPKATTSEICRVECWYMECLRLSTSLELFIRRADVASGERRRWTSKRDPFWSTRVHGGNFPPLPLGIQSCLLRRWDWGGWVPWSGLGAASSSSVRLDLWGATKVTRYTSTRLHRFFLVTSPVPRNRL